MSWTRNVVLALAAAAFAGTAAAQEIKISHQWKANTDVRDRAARVFVEEVNKRDPGLKFRIYPSSSLEKVKEAFEAPADLNTRLGYGWSVLPCLSSAMAGANPAGTGAVMRPSVLEGYALAAGFRAIEVLPIEDDQWRFYRLRG